MVRSAELRLFRVTAENPSETAEMKILTDKEMPRRENRMDHGK
jgi:hypothetical protein